MHELCVVFDIDDTLYLERDYVRSGFQAVGKWAEDWLDVHDFFDACWREFESGQRSSIFNRALAARGQESSPELISCLVELYRSHAPCIELAPDAFEAIEQIARTCPIAIVSDGPVASQSRKADALGLRSLASPVILTGIFGAQFRKPHTRAFAQVAARVPARRYVYVADNPAKDFAGPNELGWATIRVRRPEGLHALVDNNPHDPPNIEVTNCTDLLNVVAGL